jgi:hypothetical protein
LNSHKVTLDHPIKKINAEVGEKEVVDTGTRCGRQGKGEGLNVFRENKAVQDDKIIGQDMMINLIVNLVGLRDT